MKTKKKKIIRFVIAPGSQSDSGLDLDGLVNFLSKKSPFLIKPIRCNSYEEAIFKLTKGKAEMGWLGTFSSYEAKKIANIEPFAVGLPKGKKNTNYYSVFIVKAKSDVSKLVDVKGKKVIVGNKHSTSGYIIPKRELNNIGINIDNSLDFLELIRTENHDETIQLFLNTDAQVAAVSSVNLNDYIDRQKLDKNQIRVIHKSHPIPGAPLVFSSLLNENEKNIIKKLVFNAHNEVKIGGYGGEMERYIDVFENKQKFLESYIKPQWGWYTYISIISLIGLTTIVTIDLNIDPLQLFQNTYFYFTDVISRMVPPDFSKLKSLLYSLLETLEMAFLGTLLAILLSIPFGFFSAKNISPNYLIYLICRIITIFFRAIPEFIMAMILVIAVGFGAIPGVLALGLHTMGFLAKFYAEAIEHIDSGPGDALSSMNASKLQVITFAVIPQILPSFVANNLYILDRNIRMATMLGIVGAGGIGYELQSSFRMFNYPRVSAIIILIFTTIFIIDFISSYIRKKIV
jgi:phosphonate transport system permease protein